MTLAIALYTGLLFTLPPVLAADDEWAAHTRLNDADGSILNQAGLDRLRAGDNTGAEKFFRQSIGKDPGRGVFHNNLAVSLMRQGKYEEARGPLKKAISIDPEYAKALSNMAIVCFRLSRYREAYGYYKLSRSADREYTEVRFARDRISREVDQLMEKDPGNSVYRMMHNRLVKETEDRTWPLEETGTTAKP